MDKNTFKFDVFKNLSFSLFIVVLFARTCLSEIEICDRRPFKTNTESLSPDDRFEIEIESITDLYIPHQRYNVRLFSKDDKTTFMGFSIWLREDEADNEKNPRRPKRLDPGRLHPAPDSPGAKSHPPCNNTVVQVDITPKTSVQALWTAPGKGSQCVTLNAIVAIKPDVWYANEGPLSKRVCEDTRDADDILPTQNDDCTVCEEARYQLTFIGKWSYNTHPNMFPKALDLARFSDVVGASHSKSFIVYKYNSEASPGIQMLAEQGNTTDLELEIQKELGRSVRTVIKASAPAKTNLTTVTSFRVSKDHHFVSLATGIMPSPDWFLGVANLELCREKKDRTSEWAPTVTLNLYPYDAGTDSGKDFEASNDKTSPPQPISSLPMIQSSPQGKKKAFARIRFDLIRTYPNPSCITANPITDTEGEEEDQGETENEYYEPPDMPAPEPTSSEKPEIVHTEYGSCPMTPWEEWQCEGYGECEEGIQAGFMMKYRYHIVDGVVIGNYQGGGSSRRHKELPEVPEHCLSQETSMMENCTVQCIEEEEDDDVEETSDTASPEEEEANDK